MRRSSHRQGDACDLQGERPSEQRMFTAVRQSAGILPGFPGDAHRQRGQRGEAGDLGRSNEGSRTASARWTRPGHEHVPSHSGSLAGSGHRPGSRMPPCSCPRVRPRPATEGPTRLASAGPSQYGRKQSAARKWRSSFVRERTLMAESTRKCREVVPGNVQREQC